MTVTRYQGVIFDMDGTLLDTLADIAASVNRYLSRNALPTHPLDAYRYFVGDGSRMLIRRALPETAGEVDVDSGFAAFMEDYGQNWRVQTRLYDGIAEMLDGMTRMGVKMAILSNKPHEFVLRFVDAFLSRWRFEAAAGNKDDVPRKPDPTGALIIAREMGLAPADILYVGDSSVDMQTAAAAGMFAVGVAWGFRPQKELENHGCRFMAKQPSDIITLLKGA